MSEALAHLVAVMDRLRSPGGCPWDAEQSHRSLVTYLIEESYELIEAIEGEDRDAILEELGDLLLQVVFHARIAEEHPASPFSIDDVARAITSKLISRHDHVFGTRTAESAEEVERDWEKLKAAEKGRSSAMEGVPLAQPALALAQKMMHRASRHHVDTEISPPVDLPATLDEKGIGDLLFGIAALASRSGVDAEAALRGAARRFAEAVRSAEAADKV
jgi:XTP/dITP diphosphohydrolase